MRSVVGFFTKLWSPGSTSAERLGYAYDEQGTLIAEVGSGGAASAGQAQYVYLPTASGQMPIAAVINGATYAVHSDHLNTPRKLTNASGQPVWQWSYSAFGDEKPTIAKSRFANLDITPNAGSTNISEVKFNLRYPGQYADEESGLFYNGFRTYSPTTGRYTQGDPIGLAGGWNRFGYVGANPLMYSDPKGLFLPALAIPFIGSGSIGLGEVAAGAALAGLLMSPGDTQRSKGPDITMYNPGYKPGAWPPLPAQPDKPDAWPGEDDWRGQCSRLYAQCQRDNWTGNCGTCLNKCTAQQEWPFQGPVSCRPRKKLNSCDAF